MELTSLMTKPGFYADLTTISGTYGSHLPFDVMINSQTLFKYFFYLTSLARNKHDYPAHRNYSRLLTTIRCLATVTTKGIHSGFLDQNKKQRKFRAPRE